MQLVAAHQSNIAVVDGDVVVGGVGEYFDGVGVVGRINTR